MRHATDVEFHDCEQRYASRVTEVRGLFVIDTITYSGDDVTALDARFKQHCDSGCAALHEASGGVSNALECVATCSRTDATPRTTLTGTLDSALPGETAPAQKQELRRSSRNPLDQSTLPAAPGILIRPGQSKG